VIKLNKKQRKALRNLNKMPPASKRKEHVLQNGEAAFVCRKCRNPQDLSDEEA
jgi:hypothetical protein